MKAAVFKGVGLPLVIESLPDPEEFDTRPDLLEAQYLEMLDNAGAQILAALAILAAPDALPAVYHCTAGKDRTGLLSAILLSLLDVPEETVVDDYALSTQAMGRLRAKLIRKYPESEALLGSLDGVFSAHPSKIKTLLGYLDERYGSVHDYTAGMGAPGDLVPALRQALLEPSGPGSPPD